MKDLKDDQGIKFIFPLIPHQKTVSTTHIDASSPINEQEA